MRRLPALVLLVAAVGCAGGGDAGPDDPPLLFVRPRGVWTPEDLNRDVSECIAASHAAVVADPSQVGAPAGTARAALRGQMVACMDERGWATGSSVEPEEWAQ